MRSVPLARRNLLADRRRLAASVVGVGLAVMLILLLEGMWAGIRSQSRAYSERSGADLFVLQPGVRDLTPGVGTVSLAALDTVRSDPGVSWAAPVRSAFVILQLHGRKIAALTIGSVPGEPGGPWSITSGRAPRADDEVVVGNVLARRHDIDVGDQLDVMGHSFRVVGRSDTSGYMFSYIFLTHGALDRLTGTSGLTNYILIGATKPAEVAQRLGAAGLNVLDRETTASNDEKFATGIFGSPLRLMVGIGFAGGTLIMALTAYTAVIERRREYGIVKAMGATRRVLVRWALTQTAVFAALGFGAGIVLFIAGRAVIAATSPQFTILLTTTAVRQAALAAAGMAVLAAVVPAHRLARLEPAVAYRSGT